MGIVMRRGANVPMLLKKIYMNLRNPASFSSPYRLYSAEKNQFKNKMERHNELA